MTNRVVLGSLAALLVGCIESEEVDFDPTEATVQLAIEGESMSLPSGNGVVVTDGAASGGRTLLIWSNATATRAASLATATTQIAVRARGDMCQGVAPRMVVTVDGQQAMSVAVTSTSLASYTATLALAPGNHTFGVAFTNDVYLPGTCDRNLYVDVISLLSASSSYVVGYNFGGAGTQNVTLGGNVLTAKNTTSTATLRFTPNGGPLNAWTTTIPLTSFVPAATAAHGNLLNQHFSVSGGGLLVEQGVTNGTYQVYTYHMENNASQSRSFTVAVEGTVVTPQPIALTQYHWIRTGPHTAQVTDGVLSIELRRVTGDASIMGLEIHSSTGGQVQNLPSGCSSYGGPPTSTSPPIPGNWQVQLQDDFLGDVVDGRKWKLGGHWLGFTGIAPSDPKNATVRCGYLTMTAERRTNQFMNQTYTYASSELTSFKRFRQKYGYYEARIRYDAIRGLWPAFWLMPDRANYGWVDANRNSLIKFDLRGDGRTSVASAVLQLRVDATETGAPRNVVLARVHDDSWRESTVTWNTRPPIDPLYIEMKWNPSWGPGAIVTFDVTEYVNRQLAGDKVVSFALVDGYMRAMRVSFSSKESATQAYRPQLVVSGTPSRVYASEDASIGEGSFANQNMGAQTQLHVEEEWADTASTYNGGMEIDIMEALGHWGPNMNSHAMHWDGYGADHKSTGSGYYSIPATSDGFHVYGVSWQPGQLRYYVDGVLRYTWTNSRVGSVEAYMLLSLQMGGWADALGDNRTPDDSRLPGRMDVDYVRVWSGTPY